MAQVTDFGKAVKKRLIDVNKNTSWLADQVRKKTGMFCDQAYISRIVSGERNAPKIVAAINEILWPEG